MEFEKICGSAWGLVPFLQVDYSEGVLAWMKGLVHPEVLEESSVFSPGAEWRRPSFRVWVGA